MLRQVSYLAVIGLMLTGCATVSSDSSSLYMSGETARQIDLVAYLECITTDGAICLRSSPRGAELGKDWPSRERAIRRLEVNLSAEQASFERDRLVRVLISNSDYNCNLFLNRIRSSRTTITGGLRLTGVLTAAAAALTTPVRSANVLSGVSAATQDTSTVFQTSIFSALGAEVVYTTILDVRSRKLADVTAHLNQPYVPGSLATALGAVEAYDGLCSFQAAEANAGETLATARQAMEKLQRALDQRMRENDAASKPPTDDAPQDSPSGVPQAAKPS